MKKTKLLMLALTASILVTQTSCEEKSSDKQVTDGYGYDFTETINGYVDNVVLTTYADLKNKAWTLYDAVEKFKTAKTQANLDAVCNAWRATRIPWEQSEGFLFGPAEQLSIDPSIDSWPLDKAQIDAVIANTSLEITLDAIASSNVHGFHTIEYLIFEDGKAKAVAKLTDREVDYLGVATLSLRNDCLKLYGAWAGSAKLEGRDKTTLAQMEFNSDLYDFASRFKKAGKPGSTYVSANDAIDQIVDGCVDIASEVGSQKIDGPSKSGNVLDVESWYSWNSIDDFANNIVSIRNSYFGGVGSSSATASKSSLSAFVKSKNPALDSEISAAIDKCFKAINNDMNRPFRNNLTGAKVQAAIVACGELEKSFGKIKSLRD